MPPSPTPTVEDFRRIALERQARLTKPAGALGVLEEVAVWLADRQQTATPIARPASMVLFASDHPVSHRGVSAYPREVTAAMVRNLLLGGAAASVLCRRLSVPMTVVDVGVETPYDAPTPSEGLTFTRAPRAGTAGDLVSTSALDEPALDAALDAGARAVEQLDPSPRLLMLGEMGIGNTTPAAALVCALLDRAPASVVGPGTGIDGPALRHKVDMVEAAVKRAAACSGAHPHNILRELGGRDIAALVGALRSAAARKIPVLVDGFIVSAAALVAARWDPSTRDWMWFAHRSAEPGHAAVLNALKARPVVDAGLRLGEGSGALLAFPLVELAVALHLEMATFEGADVPDRER